MIFSLFQRKKDDNICSSQLFNEKTFYKAFLKDLYNCKNELIIESPFETASRMKMLLPIFRKLIQRGVNVHIITRDPIEHDGRTRHESTNEILKCKEMGVNIVLLTGRHHRKLAVIDNKILWEGSLNILFHGKSKEIMRRIDNQSETTRMLQFINLENLIL